MIKNRTFEINIQLIINKDLYEKNYIDENTYLEANEQLLKKLDTTKKEYK